MLWWGSGIKTLKKSLKGTSHQSSLDTTAKDLLHNFKVALRKLNMPYMVEIAMDGPSTNWKYLEALTDRIQSDPDVPGLIEVVSWFVCCSWCLQLWCYSNWLES